MTIGRRNLFFAGLVRMCGVVGAGLFLEWARAAGFPCSAWVGGFSLLSPFGGGCS